MFAFPVIWEQVYNKKIPPPDAEFVLCSAQGLPEFPASKGNIQNDNLKPSLRKAYQERTVGKSDPHSVTDGPGTFLLVFFEYIHTEPLKLHDEKK